MRFNLVQIFWGQAFGELLCRYALPNLLSPGNLPAWPYRSQTRMLIYCPEADWQAIAAEPSIAALRELIAVEPVAVPRPAADSKYTSMGLLHARAVADAIAAEAGLIFLSPDAIFSDGSFSELARCLAAGDELVLVSGPVVCQEDFEAAATPPQQHWDRDRCTRLILSHPHPSLIASHIEAASFSGYPSSVYYRDAAGLMARYFHLHPLLIKQPRPFRLELYGENPTIDGGYLLEFIDRQERIRVIQERELIAFSYHPRAEARCEQRPMSLQERMRCLLYFARHISTPLHNDCFLKPLLVAPAEMLSQSGFQPGSPQSAPLIDWLSFVFEVQPLLQRQDPSALAAAAARATAFTETLQPLAEAITPELWLVFYQLARRLYDSGLYEAFKAALPVWAPYLDRLCRELPPEHWGQSRADLVYASRERPALGELGQELGLNAGFSLLFLSEADLTAQLAGFRRQAVPGAQLLMVGSPAQAEQAELLEAQLGEQFADLCFLDADALDSTQICALICQSGQVYLSPQPQHWQSALKAALESRLVVLS